MSETNTDIERDSVSDSAPPLVTSYGKTISEQKVPVPSHDAEPTKSALWTSTGPRRRVPAGPHRSSESQNAVERYYSKPNWTIGFPLGHPEDWPEEKTVKKKMPTRGTVDNPMPFTSAEADRRSAWIQQDIRRRGGEPEAAADLSSFKYPKNASKAMIEGIESILDVEQRTSAQEVYARRCRSQATSSEQDSHTPNNSMDGENKGESHSPQSGSEEYDNSSADQWSDRDDDV